MSPSLDGGLAVIPGSTPAGGHMTPLECASWSLSGAVPVVSLERGEGAAAEGPQSALAVGGVTGLSTCAQSAVDIAIDIPATAAANVSFGMMNLLRLKRRSPGSCSGLRRSRIE
jgi:hypothetical protein